MLYQRLFAACLLLVCLCLGFVAWGYQAPFSYEPVGPRAYPLMLLILLALGALILLAKPNLESSESDEPPLNRAMLIKAAVCLGLMLALAALFERLGFIPVSILFALGMARLFGGRWLASGALALILGVGLYFLFDRLLEVPLPLGVLSALEI
ncbi:membrane protein [Halopseudomonas oceani]|jgi:putative tricarboxylic transport membrane protein|uniref:Tripartite tricarboxylate transporter TctB family protein n=1 Tax=Halopseudomonas oceani TaxID=1708783 RepID=A0A2P4EQD4_9GAMM|nr:tripartite tricarboxylate transporter TctB family protein [Halopseudomonas oceani]POB00827.1 tripartite tricarboxylate transporter TctB family protein [Halopseudomonas oceani]GGE59310.1 membrane protein [Halopseudomonas oceani]